MGEVIDITAGLPMHQRLVLELDQQVVNLGAEWDALASSAASNEALRQIELLQFQIQTDLDQAPYTVLYKRMPGLPSTDFVLSAAGVKHEAFKAHTFFPQADRGGNQRRFRVAASQALPSNLRLNSEVSGLPKLGFAWRVESQPGEEPTRPTTTKQPHAMTPLLYRPIVDRFVEHARLARVSLQAFPDNPPFSTIINQYYI